MKILEALMSTAKPDEWLSATINITAGPKETPQVNINLIPGTTKKNAIRIQEGLVDAYKVLNKG